MQDNNKKFWGLVLVISLLDLGFVLALRLTIGKHQLGFIEIAFWMALALIVQLIAGLITRDKNRLVGKAMLIATLIMLVFGFGICTINA